MIYILVFYYLKKIIHNAEFVDWKFFQELRLHGLPMKDVAWEIGKTKRLWNNRKMFTFFIFCITICDLRS